MAEHRFACAACGMEEFGRDGVMIDQWLGGPSWHYLDPASWTRIGELLTAIRPDPGALHAINWELAPFWCRSCQRGYCRDHWQSVVILDEGFYDCTVGVCPAGHRQMIDDYRGRPAASAGPGSLECGAPGAHDRSSNSHHRALGDVATAAVLRCGPFLRAYARAHPRWGCRHAHAWTGLPGRPRHSHVC